jgi:hypothetical protein
MHPHTARMFVRAREMPRPTAFKFSDLKSQQKNVAELELVTVAWT